MHSDVSNWHVALHFRVPPSKPSVAQVSEKGFVPSHSSSPSTTPSPQVVHDDVSNWHVALLHFRVPPVKPRVAQFLEKGFVPSHCSLSSTTPFPQVAGVHSDVSNWHVLLLHFRVPPVKLRLMFAHVFSPTTNPPSGVSVHSQGKTGPQHVKAPVKSSMHEFSPIVS